MACAEPTGTAANTASASIALVAFVHFDFILRPPVEDCPRPGSEQSPSHGRDVRRNSGAVDARPCAVRAAPLWRHAWGAWRYRDFDPFSGPGAEARRSPAADPGS